MLTLLFGMNRDTCAPIEWEEQLQTAGFKNLYLQWVKWPIGPWPKGRKNKLLGELFAKTYFRRSEYCSFSVFQIPKLGPGATEKVYDGGTSGYVGYEH
jgi:hypothetical protein